MKPRFPLSDVSVHELKYTRKVKSPLYADTLWQINQNEFAMQVEGIGSFYACNGTEVEYSPTDGATLASIELYLNGSVYGAILHQRKILPLHGSSFKWHDKGILICGEAGSGKSSLTASFCLEGAEFLTDDVTPILFNNGKPFIWALSDRIKLWNDTFQQLNIENNGFHSIDPETEKYYYPMDADKGEINEFDQIYIVGISNEQEVSFTELTGGSKFVTLRNEIYRYEYLQGMPDNESIYFKNIIDLCNRTRVFGITRPENIMILDLMRSIEEHLTDNRL